MGAYSKSLARVSLEGTGEHTMIAVCLQDALNFVLALPLILSPIGYSLQVR